ncbi:hypothetical protein ABFS83_11G013300 [Erythranthe nasuta]
MEKMAAVNQLRKKKKKRQPPPLKIVYITNPIKFKTSASQFRALVQELTGQYAADTPPPEPNSTTFVSDDGGGGEEAADDAVKVADENDIHHVAVDDDEVTTTTSENYIGHPANSDEPPVVHEYGSESDPSIIGLYNDVFFLSTDFSWLN